MSDSDRNDDTWEDFFGGSTELMPSVMGAFDEILETNRNPKEVELKTPRKTHQASNFSILSPNVQKILSHLPDQELSYKYSSEETLISKPLNRTFRSLRSPDKCLNKSSESLEIISHNVQKMISNFPETELILPTCDRRTGRNHSFLFMNNDFVRFTHVDSCDDEGGKTFCYHSDVKTGGSECEDVSTPETESCESGKNSESCNYNPRPLGSYLHTSPSGIASRMPAGRKNMGKYLQVPSESSVGTMSTASSEVSRPVSLTSLGSCSSSGSSGPHQPGSAYLASAESLDSDPEPTGSQGSADSGIAEQPVMSPEARVLQEVLDTETVYVADLNEVIQGYLEPWKLDPDCPLGQHLPDLFSNLEEIYRFNRYFLDNLREADCDPTKTANVFIQNNNGFIVYNEYCTNYPRTMDVLGKLTSDDNMASLFREKQVDLGHALPLGSYLLKPVQRILKYHLLLQRLSKQCESVHKAAVDLALTTMTSVASSINTMKRKHEHAVRVHEIQAQLYGWPGPDLTALGELIAEGTFRVYGARGRRHVFLFDKVLLMAKSKQDGALAYKSHIMCSNLMLVEQVRGEPLSFQVLPFDNPRLQCTLRARSPKHKREWTLQIKRVILENYTAVIPNHARQLVMQLGEEAQETEDATDKWSPLNKNSTPHYLERRSRVRKSRDLSNRRASSQDRSFPSLGSWRRKSEPGMVVIPQYNTKTLPKKISKIKKAKEGGAKFYTDLDDSENCEVNGESNESLDTTLVQTAEKCEPCEEKAEKTPDNLEKIVSDLVLQEFNRVNRRRRTVRSSEPEIIWFDDDREKLPSKADSLPRSFQLNDQIDVGVCEEKQVFYESLKETADDDDEQHENDLSSQLDDHEHPVHKIYRRSPIRFSLLQRIRALVSEETGCGQKKYPLRKQGSKSMGEKIAHPDYADPQKLFSNSCCSSRTNLSLELTECEIIDEPERLDMTISEKEVLNELEKRLNDRTIPVTDTGQNSSHTDLDMKPAVINSSPDSYYESMLEKDLVEEYIKDENGKLVAKQDSFKKNNYIYIQKYKISEKQSTGNENKKNCNVKRPTKPPPPVPVKPTHLLNYSSVINTKSERINSNAIISIETINSSTTSCNKTVLNNIQENGNQERQVTTNGQSWVKTMVGRFE